MKFTAPPFNAETVVIGLVRDRLIREVNPFFSRMLAWVFNDFKLTLPRYQINPKPKKS
jgi:hypothetical protein